MEHTSGWGCTPCLVKATRAPGALEEYNPQDAKALTVNVWVVLSLKAPQFRATG